MQVSDGVVLVEVMREETGTHVVPETMPVTSNVADGRTSGSPVTAPSSTPVTSCSSRTSKPPGDVPTDTRYAATPLSSSTAASQVALKAVAQDEVFVGVASRVP